jgi:WD40 repeat protein
VFLFPGSVGMPSSKIMLVAVLVGIVLVAGSWAGAQENEKAITALAWSSDGTRVVVGHLGGQIEIISANGQTQHSLVAHTARVTELAWHPDGSLLASGSADGSVRIWDASSGTLVRSYTGLTPITGVLWSHDGSQLWAISLQNQPNLFVWSIETGDLISSADVGGLYDPQWNEDGTLLIAGSGGTVPVLVTTRKEIRSRYIRKSDFPMVTGEQMFSAAWSPDDVYVAGGTPNGHARVWDVNTAQLVLDVGGDENYDVSTWRMSLIVELAFTPDGQQIQALDGSGVFRVWDVMSAELLIEEQLPVTGTPIYAAAFSPDETAIAYGGEDGELNVASVVGQ